MMLDRVIESIFHPLLGEENVYCDSESNGSHDADIGDEDLLVQ
jgi:hypothetical protein